MWDYHAWGAHTWDYHPWGAHTRDYRAWGAHMGLPGQHLPFREEQAFLGMQLPFHVQLPVLDEKTRERGDRGYQLLQPGSQGALIAQRLGR